MTVVENEDNELIPTRLVTGWRVCMDYRKLNDATRKDHFPLPFMDQMLERLAGNEYYYFLYGFSGYFQIPIDPQDQEKSAFTCPYGTFAHRRMPFGLCNAPGTFQRCMMAIFHDMIEETMEVFMEGYAEAIVVPPILAEHFELKHSIINLVTSKQFFGFEKEDPHAHIRYFNKITSTLKYKDVPETSIKLMLFPFSINGLARNWLDKGPPRSILTWDDLVSRFINHFFPPSKTTNLQNEISNFQQRFDESFYKAWD
ncbi:reverse transcriptase domain-containing protein [Tanacetum coccineum]